MLPDRAIRLGAAMAFLLAALSGCRQELPAGPELPDNPAEGETVVLNASLQPAEGKATLVFPSVLWDDDDEIAVFDGSSRHIFTIPEGENKGSTARFAGSASPSAAKLYAVYPASGGESLSAGSLGICIPSVQTVPDGKCADPLALVSVAHAADGNLFFRQVTALLRLELISSDVQQIRICGNSLAGKALVNPDGTLAEVTAGEDELLLQPQDGCFAPGVYYAVVLPGVTPAGTFSITVVRSGGLSGTRTAGPSVTFVRRRGLDMGEVEAALTWHRVICTRQQLFEWNLSREASDATDEVELGADIDMGMEAWTPRNFAGTFDGKGHKLWHLHAVSDNYAGFLREMTGAAVLKDITIGSSDGSTYDGASIIRHGASANNYTWYYAGVVAKASGSSSISGVQNFATVEVAADAISKTRIGGVVGNWNSSGTLTECVNRGTDRKSVV